ncbi:hypothetical protein [Mangrovibacterium lignilyticum]|uniref:hypothetical protein n=1 Tax=Mangrovibacterium lignilyticum TaxID=2668052 RepID=UPI0013D3E8EA|nr:hypothetical protein [Mangrovibacterium lignilyticum]
MEKMQAVFLHLLFSFAGSFYRLRANLLVAQKFRIKNNYQAGELLLPVNGRFTAPLFQPVSGFVLPQVVKMFRRRTNLKADDDVRMSKFIGQG